MTVLLIIPFYTLKKDIDMHSKAIEAFEADKAYGYFHAESPLSNSWVKVGNEAIRYDEFVRKLFKQLPPEMMKAHASMGVAGEAGELVDAIKKEIIYGQPINLPNVIEELGDLLFFMQAVCNIYGIPQQVILQHNAEKLEKRYVGLAYTDKAASDRADKVAEGEGVKIDLPIHTKAHEYIDSKVYWDSLNQCVFVDGMKLEKWVEATKASSETVKRLHHYWATREKNTGSITFRWVREVK